MRRQAKAPSAGSISGSGGSRARKSLFGMACACALALGALGSGAPAAAAATCPNAQFRGGPGANLPDCRAYEQVSPVDKNGFDVGNLVDSNEDAGGPATADGNAVAFQSPGAFADTKWGGASRLAYLARRGKDNWGTTSLSPPPRNYVGGATGSTIEAFSLDMTETLYQTFAQLTADPIDGSQLYFGDNSSGALSFLFTAPFSSSPVKSSLDLSHFAFTSQTTLTSDPNQPDGFKVYEFADGQLHLVARQPGTNEPFETPSGLGGTNNFSSASGAVSDDGNHIFFSAAGADGNNSIFRRDDGTSTILVSPSKRTPVDPSPQPRVFRTATADGNRVFFTSIEALTNDANESGVFEEDGDLYRYDVEADELIDITAATPGDQPGSVFGILATSASGDRVYYAAGSEVIPGQGTLGQGNLYLWEDDGTPQGSNRFIATLDPTPPAGGVRPNPYDRDNWIKEAYQTAQASLDGGSLVFQSRNNLTAYDQAGLSQVYSYDAEANGGAGELACLSCAGGPAAPAAASLMATRTSNGDLAGHPRTISADGRRIIFSSPDPLVANDTNGKYDPYLWEAQGSGSCAAATGCLYLLSPSGAEDSYVFGMSANGDDVFLRTRDQLVPQDGDTNKDLYTAHVNGGFASQFASPPPSCEGEGCRTAGTGAPAALAPLTSGFVGPGNASGKPRARKCGKGKRRVKARCVRKHQERKHDQRAQGKQRSGK